MNYKIKKAKFKTFVANTIFKFLGKAICKAQHIDKSVGEYVEALPEGFVVNTVILPHEEASLRLIKKDGHLQIAGKEDVPTMKIMFKNLSSARQVLLGKQGIKQAFAQSRFVLSGDYTYAYALTEIINIVESYIYSKKMMAKITETQYETQMSTGKFIFAVLFKK